LPLDLKINLFAACRKIKRKLTVMVENKERTF